MSKRKKLLLVNPVSPLRTGLSLNRSSRFPPLNLGIIASLTPSDWEVELVDENFETFRYRDADLVGITAFSSSATRAYELAEVYRQERIPVVMGGIHASICHAEAQQFVDAVVIGEAETVWESVLHDWATGGLKPIYRGSREGLGNLRRVRREVYHDQYAFASIQTSRGCPWDCDFCSVTEFNGRRYRRRPPEQVLEELETIPQEQIFFVDDNIVGYGAQDRQQALEIFQGMVHRGLNKRWFCQAALNVADDQVLLEWASRAGCRMMFVGIEAEDLDALADVNKRLNLPAPRGTPSPSTGFMRRALPSWGPSFSGWTATRPKSSMPARSTSSRVASMPCRRRCLLRCPARICLPGWWRRIACSTPIFPGTGIATT